MNTRITWGSLKAQLPIQIQSAEVPLKSVTPEPYMPTEIPS